jgi:hypothetical protein
MALNAKDPEERRARLRGKESPADRRARLRRFLEEEVWPTIPPEVLGVPISKAEREEILGNGPEGLRSRGSRRGAPLHGRRFRQDRPEARGVRTRRLQS